jgi:putative ABC exporter
VNLAGVARGRWRLARNTLLPRGRGRRPAAPLIGLGIAVVFTALAYFAFTAMFEELAASGGPAATQGALALIAAGAMAAMLVFDLHHAVAALLLDSDLELLRRAPLGPGTLLVIKLIDSLPRTAAVPLVLVAPATAAYATAHPLPAGAWPMFPLLMAGLWAFPLGIGTALALALVRRVPAARAREALGLVSTLVLTLLWLANSFLLPRLAGESELSRHAARVLAPPTWIIAVSPPYWFAAAVAAGADHRAAEAARWTALLAAAGVLALGLAGLSAARHLEGAFANLGPSARRRAAAPRFRGGGAVRALVWRDWRLFVRDWTVLGDVFTGAALWMLLPLVGAPLHHAAPATLARAMLLALTVGLGYEVGGRAVPFERAGLALTRISPLPAGRWVLGKLIGGAALSLPLLGIAIMALGFTVELAPSRWIEIGLAALGALLVSLAIGIWIGLEFGDPTWTNPRAMLTLTGRLAAAGLLIGQAGTWLVVLEVAERMRASLPAGALVWGPMGLAALAIVPTLAVVRRRFERLEWPR